MLEDPDFAKYPSNYEPTPVHQNTIHIGVVVRKDILCVWPYAARRYNGSGIKCFHYQTQVLLSILEGQP
jgi:hypothetical protein